MDYSFSFLLGPFFICFFFFSCLIVVAGVKYLFLWFFDSKKPTPKPAKKPIAHKKPTTVKSIEINPEEIDKIFFKKSS